MPFVEIDFHSECFLYRTSKSGKFYRAWWKIEKWIELKHTIRRKTAAPNLHRRSAAFSPFALRSFILQFRESLKDYEKQHQSGKTVKFWVKKRNTKATTLWPKMKNPSEQKLADTFSSLVVTFLVLAFIFVQGPKILPDELVSSHLYAYLTQTKSFFFANQRKPLTVRLQTRLLSF